MAKKMTLNAKEFEITTEVISENPILDNIAFGVSKKEGTKLYSVYSVKYNPVSYEAGEVTILTKDVDFYEAQHQFRTLVIKSGMLS